MIDHLHQLAVHAYYAGELDAGRRACERLLRGELPGDLDGAVRRNRTWYTQSLDELAGCRMARLDVEPAAEGWSLFNPSLVAADDGWLVNVRSSNYQIVDGRYVMPETDGGTIKTGNILVRVGDDLVVRERGPVLAADYARTDYPVDGLEDVRLNAVGGELVASATVRNVAPLDGTCRIATATVDREAGRFAGIHCPASSSARHEKNWMPISGRREWLYSCWLDGHVATVRPAGADWEVSVGPAAPPVARGFRGGSQLVPIGNGRWLALVHEVAEDGRRIYEHRFVAFDEADGFAICGVSPAFAFRETRAIEFAAGLAVKGDRLVASFGVRDAEAWLAEMSLAEITALVVAP